MTSTGQEKRSESLAQVAGIDISKHHLDVPRHPSRATRRLTNDKAGHKALLGWFGRLRVESIVFEARASLGCGLTFARIKPRQARRCAEATGQLAKTERVEAAMLARLGTLLQPEARAPNSDVPDALTELVAARRALVKDRTACLNRAKVLRIQLLKSQGWQRLRPMEAPMAAVDRLC